jgi:cyclopropane fatty-acyl-phospholipid synthase-like methyltransferase
MTVSFFWDVLYLFKKTPWDTGSTPPEIVAAIASGKAPIGRALDLGCGTGTNAIYLAQHGYDLVAIDVSRRAIALARRRTRLANVTHQVRFARGDVVHMQRWVPANSIGFAYDIGCFHSLTTESRRRYVAALTAVLRPGAVYMLYAFEPQADRRGVALDEIAALFDRIYRLDELRHGTERGGRSSAWYTLIKRSE